ncbi:MAG TPA: ATP-binding cassette domain-containing protein, partial [Balneolaceae bacterium]|nr:ATP-binding cassette domain-containing protein [Balneolaceae bacterium]
MNIVSVQNLVKNYDEVEALRGISFEIEEGELFGFIGPDGAGKTTLFRILTTLLQPDKGTATVLNLDTVNDYRAIRSLLGYMPG